ncbi:MAG: MerR family transcriptional regulator [Oscillospiraceae bacterium]|nr:MerR family transcriptional regulator [Oscillospiraceae bacterium]
MTIKEIEARTGLPRANVRYYEAEGLIHPERKENGYRVYSEEDAAALQKIRLLRCLDISIEEIKAIQAGTASMEEALRKSLETQEEKQLQLQRSRELTRRMLAEKVTFETLDAPGYLQLLESEEILKQDQAPIQNHPWRRYFARCMDVEVCSLMMEAVFYDYLNSQMVSLAAGFALLLLLEPLLLHLFGTTLGKWILGIRVLNGEERRLSYGDAMERTWTVMWEGQAMNIPVISWYFLYKNYNLCEEGEALPWEWDSEVSYRDDKMWRWLVYFLVDITLISLFTVFAIWKEGLL